MFKTVAAVTIVVNDLDSTEAAYHQYLEYEVVERGVVSELLAESWGAPAMMSKRYICMQAASGADFYLRLIESTPVKGYVPLTTEGWNATELLVKDPDDLAQRLTDSPFEIIGMPRDLSSDGHVRAMQVQGPSGEVIYLTRVSGKRTLLYGEASSTVDRGFILTLGAKNFDEVVEFYGERYNHKVLSFGKVPIRVISNAFGLPQDTAYPMKVAQLGDKFSIEMEQLPEQSLVRQKHEGELPPGMAMVTFVVESIDDMELKWHRAPVPVEGVCYQNQRAASVVGPAGEWIEFVLQD